MMLCQQASRIEAKLRNASVLCRGTVKWVVCLFARPSLSRHLGGKTPKGHLHEER